MDSSVAVAACLSSKGASRQVFDFAAVNRWELVISPWVVHEVSQNLGGNHTAEKEWLELRARTVLATDELTFEWPLVFQTAKDKPVLCTALASADVLLTLDRRDFQSVLGKSVYGLQVSTPGAFLRGEREAGRFTAS